MAGHGRRQDIVRRQGQPQPLGHVRIGAHRQPPRSLDHRRAGRRLLEPHGQGMGLFGQLRVAGHQRRQGAGAHHGFAGGEDGQVGRGRRLQQRQGRGGCRSHRVGQHEQGVAGGHDGLQGAGQRIGVGGVGGGDGPGPAAARRMLGRPCQGGAGQLAHQRFGLGRGHDTHPALAGQHRVDQAELLGRRRVAQQHAYGAFGAAQRGQGAQLLVFQAAQQGQQDRFIAGTLDHGPGRPGTDGDQDARIIALGAGRGGRRRGRCSRVGQHGTARAARAHAGQDRVAVVRAGARRGRLRPIELA
ncbi:MAG: hypothetical protein ABT00_14820 [Bordetella sp. SCN 68-11]|nr:MAG: hypothetical protein ABT00_14820 [Bordetella sp. SCN 68-11]